MTISPTTIIKRLVLYTIMLIAAELTLGNKNFPINFWYFETIAPWQWSLPIHLTGFALLWFLNIQFYKKPIALPITLSLLFFIAGETANALFLHYFAYTNGPLGPAGSFAAIIVLYLVLCAMFSFIFRFDIRAGT